MSNSSTPVAPSRGVGLSIYANLLDPSAPSAPGSISKAPVVFKTKDTSEDAVAKKLQIDAAALRFQPLKRPQLPQKSKPKSTFPKPNFSNNNNKPSLPEIDSSTPVANYSRPQAKNTLADWTADEDVNDFYGGEKRQRGGRKRRKKNREEQVVVQDWDDIYDPSRPNNYEEYKHSDEKVREVTEWKDRLYVHRKLRKPPSDLDSEEEDYRPQVNRQFAPPPNFSFAPPPINSPPEKRAELGETNITDQPISLSQPPSPPPPEVSNSIAIARGPVRYNLPPPPTDIPSSEAELEEALAADENQGEDATEESKSSRPGQQGFAARLMSKYGWSKGKGLGADESGIVNALSVKVEKRKKKSDAEGGGFRDSGARGKIVGGKKNVPEKDTEAGKFGPMSETIILRGMVDGINLDEEVEGGGLMQEIGEECAEKYGMVERVYIHRHGLSSPVVFVKFTSPLSALRAVNALEGRIFNGNTISAMFYETELFEKNVYEP